MNVRKLRLEQELTLDELGRRSGVERTRLSRAERGYAVLTDGEIERIADALGVSQSEIVPDDSATA